MPDIEPPGPASAKQITALLREARSLSRRAVNDGAAAADDARTLHLCAEACASMDNLVHQLMLLERQQQRHEKAAIRRDR